MSMPDDLRERAWQLVKTYFDAHMSELPPRKRRKFSNLNEATVAPLGALVDYELARRNLSYAAASQLIARQLGDDYGAPVINPSTLCYFKKPERKTWQAKLHNLQQLAIGFEWDLEWLRAVNCEPVNLERERPNAHAMRRRSFAEQEDISAIIDTIADLHPDERSLVAKFATNLREAQRAHASGSSRVSSNVA